MYLIILLYALCASMFTISKWGLSYSSPIFFVAVRMILAGTLLCGYVLARTGWQKTIVSSLKHDWFLFLQLIFFHIYLTYICDLCALASLSSIESAVIYNLSPFIAALLSFFWFHEIMTPKKWLGLLIGFLAFLPQIFLFGSAQSSLWPRILTLLAVISSSYGWVLLRALMKKGYSPLVANGVGMFFGGVIALATSYAIEPWSPSPVTCWSSFMQAIILIVVVANLLFYNLYGYLLKHYTATLLSFAGFSCPLFTALLGYLFLGETFSPTLFISFVCVCVGLALFYHEELRQGYVTY